ncbi:MAG: tRNA (adenosine(37)-N6)-threonylcarbamoyltransferase complex dimerization subunit type 1 TsaB [Bacteroidota bacterium]|nr:tRNA (adenosine(37)-N6)-threonylcarbamoyltransferase complex dimerization subunit type 1 TsaB [Bacteroidota bacterium]
MPLILNIETATTVCSVALGLDGKLLASKELNGEYTHAENLTVFIEEVMKQAGKNLSELDAISVSKGPGSYTGLRIGVSSAKGFCYSLNKPLIGINTLQHMALSVSNSPTSNIQHPISVWCPMIDARRMEVYCALFDKENKFLLPTSALIIDEKSFGDILSEEGKQLVFFGDGAEKCKNTLSHYSNAVFLPDIVPSAINMIPLSEQAFLAAKFEDIAYFEPFYLKDFVAGKKKKSE